MGIFHKLIMMGNNTLRWSRGRRVHFHTTRSRNLYQSLIKSPKCLYQDRPSLPTYLILTYPPALAITLQNRSKIVKLLTKIKINNNPYPTNSSTNNLTINQLTPSQAQSHDSWILEWVRKESNSQFIPQRRIWWIA